jgi:HK97 family phage major capsid protein|nr:MAG TPA: major capsid protein [Caudoviricetes sp.]
MNILARLQEIESRKKEIRNILGTDKGADLDALEKELRDLQSEKEQLEKRQALLDQASAISKGIEEARSLGTVNDIINPAKEEKRTEKVDIEERGKKLKENRSVSVGSSDLILPNHQSTTINGTFNQVSSLIDGVKHVPLNGGESYKTAYEKSHGEGGYTGESEAAHTADVEFGYAEITKSKITSYSEETEEVVKLPAADYDSVIVGGVGKSLRKKITKEILVGDGGANHLVGIFSDKAKAIEAETDLEISTIDETTLDDIIFSFGGDEDVEDTSVLILNKADVKAFAKLRTQDGKKVYDVKAQGNKGTIDGVPYIINSACNAISNSTTVTGQYCMAYGPLSNYELATFSETEVKRSTDSKFKEGMIAHRGVVFVGGNVAAHNGFLRIKKK